MTSGAKDSTSRKNRSTELIAKFINGYAEGWFFAVGESFKDELDIKLTDRKENGKTVKVLTQGPYYSFKEGHTFYDTPDGYLEWQEALKRISLICEVIRGTPNQTGDDQGMISGGVTFTLSKPNRDKTNIETIGQHTVTQDEFVEYLKTGNMPSDKGK